MFEAGQKVEHILNHEYLLVIGYNEEGNVVCRTKAFDLLVFYEFELKAISK